MRIQKTEITIEDQPRRYQAGERADIIVSTPRGKHYLFMRDSEGQTRFIYGGHGANSEPSKKIVEAARSA